MTSHPSLNPWVRETEQDTRERRRNEAESYVGGNHGQADSARRVDQGDVGKVGSGMAASQRMEGPVSPARLRDTASEIAKVCERLEEGRVSVSWANGGGMCEAEEFNAERCKRQCWRCRTFGGRTVKGDDERIVEKQARMELVRNSGTRTALWVSVFKTFLEGNARAGCLPGLVPDIKMEMLMQCAAEFADAAVAELDKRTAK